MCPAGEGIRILSQTWRKVKHGAPRKGLSWKELILKVGDDRPPTDSAAAKLGPPGSWPSCVRTTAMRVAGYELAHPNALNWCYRLNVSKRAIGEV